MKKTVMSSVKSATCTIIFCLYCVMFSFAQQNIIANKDNTHPEIVDLSVPGGVSNYFYKPLKIEQVDGKVFTATDLVLDGTISPVTIYPTIISGNMVNVNAGLPVEKIVVYSAAGQQVFARDIGGRRDYIPVVIPSLGKGVYMMTFYGKGWMRSKEFIIP